MHDCGNCNQQCSTCGGCNGCGGSLTMTSGEITVLKLFGQIPFLPVARCADTMEPVFLEETQYTPREYTLILQHLEAKGLIRIDYDKPMQGADMSKYEGYPIHGSMALTARGQQVLDLLDIQGEILPE